MINKNLAAIIVKQKKNLKIVDLEIPKVPKGFALIKMKYSGICHTQLNEISGILGKDKFLPHCMGHEGMGEIVSIGKLVRNFKVGDYVVVSWIKKKTNKRFSSISYKKNSTIINSGGCNTLLNYSLVSENRIFKISRKNKYHRESILLGCALPTASNAILNNSSITKKSKVLIMGMGGLGYASLFVLSYLRCMNIICIDSNINKLNILKNKKKFNFIYVNKKKLDELKKKYINNFDLIIDCTGSKNLIEKTFSLLKPFSGRFIMIGNTKKNEKISINAWDFIAGKTLTGAWGNGGTIMKNFKTNEKILIDQISNIKKVLPKKNYKLKEINKALFDFKNGKILRPIIKF